MNDVNTVTIIRNTVRFLLNVLYKFELVRCSRNANETLIRLFIYSFINTNPRILRNLMNIVRFVVMQ